MNIWLSVLLSSFFSFQAFAKPLTGTEAQHVVIGRDLSVPGDRLCQDGVYLYFLNLEDCKANQPDSKCRGFEAGPIQQAEEIFFDKGRKISRFYLVNTEYAVATYKVDESNQKIYQGHSIQTVAPCADRPQLPESTIFEQREAEDNELGFIRSFALNGITVLNTPYGAIRNLSDINPESHRLDRIATIHFGNIKSPQCFSEEDESAVRKASGEFSGGGIIKINIPVLQRLSGQITSTPGFNKTGDKVQFNLYRCNKSVTI